MASALPVRGFACSLGEPLIVQHVSCISRWTELVASFSRTRTTTSHEDEHVNANADTPVAVTIERSVEPSQAQE